MTTVTKKTHFNPCFWTAFWNRDYFKSYSKGVKDDLDPRCQNLYVLNIISNKIYKSTTQNVHFKNYLGQAEITENGARKFCKRVFPDKYEEFVAEIKPNDYPLLLDFENVFTGIENMPPYQILKQIISKNGLNTSEERIWISCFIVLHFHRNHAVINSIVQFGKKIGLNKFEHLFWLKKTIENDAYLMKLVMPIVFAPWIIYRVKANTFPLCDSPILSKNQNIMVALSPRLLLEIDMTRFDMEFNLHYNEKVLNSKLKEFRKRTIANTFSEIIFHDKAVLKKWQKTTEFKRRHNLLKNKKSYNRLIFKHGSEEL